MIVIIALGAIGFLIGGFTGAAIGALIGCVIVAANS